MDDPFAARIAEKLTGVPGIKAVALGGSRARGSHHPSSDYDLALYYDPSDPLDRAALKDEFSLKPPDFYTRFQASVISFPQDNTALLEPIQAMAGLVSETQQLILVSGFNLPQ